MIRRLILVSTVALVGTLGLAAPALAHIDPDPAEAQAGATLTVGFTVEHGCDGSPTVEISMRLPDGVTEAAPVPLEGWNERIEDGVVTYTGGPLPADAPGTFEITMTLPATPDTTVFFPFVQRCEVGEIRWIALPDDSGDEPDEPAPALDLIGPAISPPPADSAAPSDSAAGGDADAATTAPSVVEDDSADTTSPTVISPADTASDDDTDSSTGTIVFIISVIAVLIVGAIAVMAARRNRPGGGGDTSGLSGGDVA